jgi:peptidoglycan glycosyltransferase
MRRVVSVGILVIATGAITGAILTFGGGPDRLGVAERYTRAWARGDFRAMYGELTPTAQRRVTAQRFAVLHRERFDTATGQSLGVAGPARELSPGVVRVPIAIRTRIYGRVAAPVDLPVAEDGDAVGVDWKRYLAFPGLRPGEELTRTVEMPARATLQARDGAVLAQGEARTPGTELADLAPDVVGQLGPPPPERAARLRALGIPDDTQIGLSGLERALDERLLGTPGGELLADGRVLARTKPKQADAVRTTIAPSVVRAAVAALAGRVGGVVALDPRSGEVLGYAGIAFSGLQPPGSTFKIITLTGALEAGITREGSSYPVETEAVLEGVSLENANGERCGGSLAQSFAESCNSVFAPLGAKLGAEKLVEVAERFGFNGEPLLPGARVAAIPTAAEIGDDLAVGSSAIGQGRVEATALQLATVAATIADGGGRPRLTLDLDAAKRSPKASLTPVTTPTVAATVEKLMQGVVRSGTGTSAAIPGVPVAGKTGTAELEATRRCETPPAGATGAAAPDNCFSASDPTDTDAWFAAFAPAGRRAPRVAVGVLLVRAGAGGETAAPVARQVLRAALGRR